MQKIRNSCCIHLSPVSARPHWTYILFISFFAPGVRALARARNLAIWTAIERKQRHWTANRLIAGAVILSASCCSRHEYRSSATINSLPRLTSLSLDCTRVADRRFMPLICERCRRAPSDSRSVPLDALNALNASQLRPVHLPAAPTSELAIFSIAETEKWASFVRSYGLLDCYVSADRFRILFAIKQSLEHGQWL